MCIIEIEKTGEVLGVELFVVNQVFITKDNERSEVRRLGKTITKGAAIKLAREIKRGIEDGGGQGVHIAYKTTLTPARSWAIIETLGGNYKLKTLAAADKAGDSIEQELYGTKEEAQAQFKQHLEELKKGGYFEK